jgi:hypothetical protein
VLDAIEVDAPVVRLTQHSLGKLDIDDVIARLSEPEDEEPSKPVSFALYNIALRDGRIELNDEFVQRKHELKDLQLSIPFISNLASKREIKVLPHLAFDLNGSKFDTSGESTPFTDTRQTAMHLKWDQSIWPLIWAMCLPAFPCSLCRECWIRICRSASSKKISLWSASAASWP